VVVLVRAAQPLLRQAYVYHLMDDWIFNRQNASESARILMPGFDQFARRIVRGCPERRRQEILVVATAPRHLAIEVLTRALASIPK